MEDSQAVILIEGTENVEFPPSHDVPDKSQSNSLPGSEDYPDLNNPYFSGTAKVTTAFELDA